MRKSKLYLICSVASLLASCGDSELSLYSPVAITPDIIVNIEQVSHAPWTAQYKKGARSLHDFLPLGDTVRIRFKANESGHILLIPSASFSLPGVAGQKTEGSIVVTKTMELGVVCGKHLEEETGLTLKFK